MFLEVSEHIKEDAEEKLLDQKKEEEGFNRYQEGPINILNIQIIPKREIQI